MGEQCYSPLQLHCTLIEKCFVPSRNINIEQKNGSTWYCPILLFGAQWHNRREHCTATTLLPFIWFPFSQCNVNGRRGGGGAMGIFRWNSFETLGRQLIHPIEIADNHFQFQFWIFEEDIWPTQLEWLSQPDNDFLLTEIWSLTSDSDKKLDNSIYVVYQSTFTFESAPRQRRKFNLTTLKNGRCQFFLGSGMLSRGREILSAFLSPNWRPSDIF